MRLAKFPIDSGKVAPSKALIPKRKVPNSLPIQRELEGREGENISKSKRTERSRSHCRVLVSRT